MIRIKDNVDLKELKKYGFEYDDRDFYRYDRYIDNNLVWTLYTTKTHHNLQIAIVVPCTLAKELQTLIYKMTKDDLLEISEE